MYIIYINKHFYSLQVKQIINNNAEKPMSEYTRYVQNYGFDAQKHVEYINLSKHLYNIHILVINCA